MIPELIAGGLLLASIAIAAAVIHAETSHRGWVEHTHEPRRTTR